MSLSKEDYISMIYFHKEKYIERMSNWEEQIKKDPELYDLYLKMKDAEEIYRWRSEMVHEHLCKKEKETESRS